MAAEWRQVVSEMRCHKIGTEQRILQASVCRCRSLRMLRCPSCGFLPAGLCNGRFAPRFCLLLKMLSGKLHQLQVLMLAMPKCSLLLLQIMKDRTETMSMLLFRSWSSCRYGCLPGCSSTCRDPDAGIATTWLYADMYLNGPDSFVRLEEDATALAIEQAWHRLCHQAPHFWKRSMCMCKSIAKGKLCGPESLPDAVFLNGV